jgi:hypothetical protein
MGWAKGYEAPIRPGYRSVPAQTATPPEIRRLQRDWKHCGKTGELCAIRLENAEADAERALKAGDRRMLGIAGYTVSIPEAGPHGIRFYDREKVGDAYRIVEGTTDFMIGREHGDLIDYATHYAAIYNSFILKNRDRYR